MRRVLWTDYEDRFSSGRGRLSCGVRRGALSYYFGRELKGGVRDSISDWPNCPWGSCRAVRCYVTLLLLDFTFHISLPVFQWEIQVAITTTYTWFDIQVIFKIVHQNTFNPQFNGFGAQLSATVPSYQVLFHVSRTDLYFYFAIFTYNLNSRK